MTTSAENIIFRPFQEGDREQVRQLHEVALRGTNAFAESGNWDSDLDDVQANYIDNGGNFVVGELDGEIVAMGAYRKLAGSETIAELKRARVRPDLQSQGIGKHLLALREAEIRERGYTAMQCDTTVNQPAAQHVLESAGFVELRRETEGWPIEVIFYRKELA